MARQYTVGPQLAGDIILVHPQNNEINQAVGELNGSLDQNNMPLNSVSRVELVAPVVTVIATDPAQTNYVYPSQAYYLAQKCSSSVSLPVSTWSLGWNSFEAAGSAGDRTGFVLDFVAQEGMLKGEALIDFEHRQSYYLFHKNIGGGDAGFIAKVKDQHTGELGVFVNDVLVARTGPVYIACGRHTYTIPYATPVKSGPVHVDVRWLIDYKNVEQVFSAGVIYNVGVNQIYPVQVYSRQLWCRNQYR
jgi:hypothetical protein